MSFSERLKQIAESARSKRLSLWVGAGISRNPPASLPSADDLKFYVLKRICDHPELQDLCNDLLRRDHDIGAKIWNYPFEAFVENISRNDASIVTAIRNMFQTGSPNRNHMFIARLMKKSIIQEIATTNFDLLIEQALESVGWKREDDFKVYYREDQFLGIPLGASIPTIFKIHGSANDESSMRVTLSQVASKTLSENRTRVLVHFLGTQGGDVLILGYSARDQFDINPALSRIAPKKRILYVQHEPEGEREVGPLPQAFQNFDGWAIRCNTDIVIDYLWRAFGIG